MNNKEYSFRIMIVLLALAVSGCAAPGGTPGSGYIADVDGLDDWQEAAEIELRQGEPMRAVFWLGRILEQDPGRSSVRIQLARILLHERQLETVLSVLQEHAIDGANKAEAEEILAMVFLRQGRFDEARRHLDQSLDADPSHWRSWNALGVMLDLEGRNSEARMQYREALLHSPENPKVLNNLGYSYFLSGELDTAERILRYGQSRAPHHARIVANLGIVLAWQGRDQEAIKVFETSLNGPAARNNVGYVAMLKKRHEDARYWFETALSGHVRYYVRASENLRRNASIKLVEH